ncbi:type IV toxin-antitoxin system AbiEi family antitoxin [Undibacterium sp. Di26W]|uniref:type IV toxin-antitoxin system AbiEi family antitoxin n=1 Tax=Undibacterium sp. Di26W TaxID=3413035 RepID=UPI003BF1AE41
MSSIAELSYDEAELIQAALSALEAQTGIRGNILHTDIPTSADRGYDAVIELHVQGKPYQYQVECKRLLDRKITIAQVKEQFNKSGHKGLKGLLIAPYLSAEMAEYCRSVELAFLDTAGNAYLHDAGLYVFVKGLKSGDVKIWTGADIGKMNPTVMKMVFAVLCQPEILHMSFRDIAKQAKIPLSMVGDAFQYLIKRGHLLNPQSPKNRQFVHYTLLLEEWVTLFPSILLPKLRSRRFSCADSNWWQTVNLDGIDAVWGGEVAAKKLTNYLRPVTQTLYVNDDVKVFPMSAKVKKDMVKIPSFTHDLIKTHRLRPDPEGAIEIREKFWNFSSSASDQHLDVAPPMLVYADLMASLEPRNIELARLINEMWVDHA